MDQLKAKQSEVFNLFDRILKNDMLKHAYLFDGKSGGGKLDMARYIAKCQLCPQSDGANPDLTCSHCQRIDAGEHPDVVEVFPEGASRSIKVDRIRDLKAELTKSGMETSRKIIIVDQVETMTASAANSLLKFIEEPDGDVTIFLLTSNKQQILPTIVSRCQVIPFKDQPAEDRIKELTDLMGLSPSQAHLAAHLTQDTQEGKRLVEDFDLVDKADLICRWFNRIVKEDGLAFIMVQKDFLPIVSGRQEADLVLDLALYLYRDLLHLYFDLDYSVLAFYNYKKDLVYYASQMTLNQINNSLQAILKAKTWLKTNVAVQAVLEDLTLALLTD